MSCVECKCCPECQISLHLTKALHDVAIQQRNQAWAEQDRLTRILDKLATWLNAPKNEYEAEAIQALNDYTLHKAGTE